jgi:5-dehydro-2-deoxygluconokinase
VIPEVLTVGRVSVDLYPEQIGVPLAEVRTFRKMLGGSPTNVAVAAARLGRRAAVVTKVGDDPFGEYVRRALLGFGVDASRVGTHPTLRTPLAFCEIFPPDRFPLLFYREPKAPDLELEPDDLDAASEAKLFWTTGTGLSAEPSRTTTLAALARRGRRPITVHDLDYRAVFWASPEQAARRARDALEHATVVVGNAEEVAVALGDELEPDDLDAASEAKLFWTTGTGLSAEPSCTTTLAALARRGRRPITVHDLDFRAVFWASPEQAARRARDALEHATVVVGNAEEVAVALGDELEPERAAEALLELGPELAIVKLGAEGVVGATAEQVVAVPAVEVEVVNGLGAGDAFGGALCHGLLAGWPLERTLRFANAAGALVAARLGCADDMPTATEVDEVLCAA